MSEVTKMLSKQINRAVLSLGGLAIFGYSAVTEYFNSEQTFAIITLIFAFWFATKGNGNNGEIEKKES